MKTHSTPVISSLVHNQNDIHLHAPTALSLRKQSLNTQGTGLGGPQIRSRKDSGDKNLSTVSKQRRPTRRKNLIHRK